MLSRAQDALDAARAKRHGSFAAYRPNVERDALRKESVRATDEIVAALNERRIVLAFEPVVEAAQPPARVLRMPDAGQPRRTARIAHANEIIPVAERARAGAHARPSRARTGGGRSWSPRRRLRASVNVSPASTIDPDWWAGLGALLRAHPGVAERLIIEITETAAIQDIDDTRGFVARVKDLGCRIAIDDFGAGYTSFRNLRKLGVDIVKIDGAFVQNIDQVGRRPRLRAHADRSGAPARSQDRRRMGAGRGGRRDARRLGLRLSAGRADRACIDRAAVAWRKARGVSA